MRSFRDPASRLHFIGPHLVRQVYAEFAPAYRSLLTGEYLSGLLASGELVGTSLHQGEAQSLAEHARRHLIIEYVTPEDPQFRRISRGRDALYRHLSAEHFEAAAAASFRVLEQQETGNHGRRLYLLEKRDAC